MWWQEYPPGPLLLATILTIGIWAILGSPFESVFFNAWLYAVVFVVIGQLLTEIYIRKFANSKA